MCSTTAEPQARSRSTTSTNGTYQAANTSFVEFNGGGGTDTLEFTAAGSFNASSFSNKVADTEVIHLGTVSVRRTHLASPLRR